MIDDEPPDPSLEHVFRAHQNAVLGSLYGALPGVIVSYDPATRRASIQPSITPGELDENDERAVSTLPILQDVPVMMPGTTKLRIKFPINVGDGVLVIFVGLSMDAWKNSSTNSLTDPDDDTRHNYSDCVAIPGLASFKDAGEDSAIIEFTGSNTVQIGGTDPLVTKTDFLNHTHVGGTNTPSAPTAIVGSFGYTSKLRG